MNSPELVYFIVGAILLVFVAFNLSGKRRHNKDYHQQDGSEYE